MCLVKEQKHDTCLFFPISTAKVVLKKLNRYRAPSLYNLFASFTSSFQNFAKSLVKKNIDTQFSYWKGKLAPGTLNVNTTVWVNSFYNYYPARVGGCKLRIYGVSLRGTRLSTGLLRSLLSTISIFAWLKQTFIRP